MVVGLHWAVTPSSWCGFGFQKGLTNEEDLIGLWRHQMEFVLHYSFAYTIMSPDESLCLGCLYINPCRKMGYDAEVSMWGRSSEFVNNLDSELYSCIKKWIDEAGPFSRTTYPVRPITVES